MKRKRYFVKEKWDTSKGQVIEVHLLADGRVWKGCPIRIVEWMGEIWTGQRMNWFAICFAADIQIIWMGILMDEMDDIIKCQIILLIYILLTAEAIN